MPKTAPVVLSKELAAILGVKKDEKMSRSAVTKKLFAYVKQENLKDPDNKQWFTPNKLMAPIFGTEKIKAFGMTKYLKEHMTSE